MNYRIFYWKIFPNIKTIKKYIVSVQDFLWKGRIKIKKMKTAILLVVSVLLMGSMTACGTTNTGTNAAEQGNNNTVDQGADTKADKNGDGIIDDAVNDVTEGIDNAVDDMTDNEATDKGTVR